MIRGLRRLSYAYCPLSTSCTSSGVSVLFPVDTNFRSIRCHYSFSCDFVPVAQRAILLPHYR